jgi:hypothetical protein
MLSSVLYMLVVNIVHTWSRLKAGFFFFNLDGEDDEEEDDDDDDEAAAEDAICCVCEIDARRRGDGRIIACIVLEWIWSIWDVWMYV